MIKAKYNEKKDKMRVQLNGEGLELVNESIVLFSSIIAGILYRVYDGDLNQMTQESDKVINCMKSNIEQRMAYRVEQGGK